MIPDRYRRTLQRWMHRLFVAGMVLKGADGVLEILGGLFLLLVTRAMLNSWLHVLLAGELTEDPQDFLANYFLRIGSHLTVNSKTFAGVYLVGHGLIKVVLVVNLLRARSWAYPTAMVAMLLFIGFQAYRLSARYSDELAALTLLDMVVLGLILQEYRRKRRAGLIRRSPD